MDESSRCPRSLDPSAEEFHPTPHQNPVFITPINFFPPLPPPMHLILPYPPLFPPPPPPSPAYFNILQSPLPPPDYVQTLLQPASTGSPSRTLLLTSVPPHAAEATVRAEMEVFGEVRAVEMEKAYEGMVTVHFYDLRDSQAALREIRAQRMHQQNSIIAFYDDPSLTFPAPGRIAGCAVWAQFIIPAVLDCVPDGHNHGTIVIFNLDSNISAETLKRIFEAFGTVKELRDTPLKRHQKFLEFFDVRHAAKAAREMNGKMIRGKQIAIDFSRPGGHVRRSSHVSDFSRSKFLQQQSTPALLPSSQNSARNICTNAKKNNFPAATEAVAPRSHPCQARRPTKTTTATCDDNNASNDSKSCSIICNGGTTATVEDSMSSSGNAEESNDAVFDKKECRKVAGNKIFAGAGGGIQFRLRKSRSKGLDPRFLIREDVITDCVDSRTTVMIKNIPNKYSQKLLLSLLDNHCAHCNDQILRGGGGVGDEACLSSYDFVYLPMDFNNKCNVGYGFVNMTSPEATMRLYKAFHCQSWEVFNSRKICQVTYARVQGLQTLKEHFRNSKFPSGSDEILPVVFEPPRDGRRQLTPPQAIYGLGAWSENGSSCFDDQSNGSHVGSQGCADEEALCVKVDVAGLEGISDQNGGGDVSENR